MIPASLREPVQVLLGVLGETMCRRVQSRSVEFIAYRPDAGVVARFRRGRRIGDNHVAVSRI